MCSDSGNGSWGGAREGSGRKRKYVKNFYFGATEEVAAVLEAVPAKERTEFVNDCILKAVGKK